MNKQIKKTKDFASEIANKIQKEDIKMKPKAYFALGTLLSSLGVIIFSILGTFFTNMIIHRMRITRMINEVREVPPNFRFMLFFRMFPWEYLLLSIGFIILGLYLIRKFDVSYKKSYTQLVILFLITVALTAFGMDKLGFNERAKHLKHIRGVYGPQSQTNERPPFVKGMNDKRQFQKKQFERNLPPRMYK